MSRYEYPMLSRSEIVAVLAESQITNISEQDFINPKFDFVSDLYTRLLINLDSMDEDDQGQLQFADLDHLENPDFHVESVRTINLYNRIKNVVASVDCPKKFTLKDLINPDTVRTEVFVSTFLNFCLYKNTKMNLLRPIVEELTLLDEQRNEREARISQLTAEIENYSEARERELPFVQEVTSKVKELHETISDLNNHQRSLRTSFRKAKEKAEEMDEKITSAEYALVESVQENAHLRSLLVQSPDKLQKALEEKKSVLEEAKNAERLAMHAFQEKAATADVYTKAFKKMSKHLTQMQAIQEQVNSSKSIEKNLKALKSKLSDEALLEKSLQAKLIERQGKLQQLEDMRKQLENERDIKYEEASQQYNNVKVDVESRRRDLEARQKKVEAVVAQVDVITSKTNSVKETAAAKQQVIIRKCEDLVKELHQYSASISSCFESF